MSDRILTSHAGSLPRPEDLVESNLARSSGEKTDEAAYEEQLGTAVDDVVARQKELGIDIVNDGEYGHSMGERYDYGAWWSYVFPRLGGLELDEVALLEAPQARPKPGEVALASFAERRDWQQFSEAYDDPSSGAALPNRPPVTPVARGPVTYTGQEIGRARHRQLQGGARVPGPAGRLSELGGAGQLRALWQRVLRG